MIKVYLPKGNYIEKKYVIDYVFSQFSFSGELEISETEEENYIFEYNELKICIKDCFLNKEKYSNIIRSDDDFIFRQLQYQGINYYSFFGGNELNLCDNTIEITSDIIGTIFWILTRYEEYFGESRDKHNRFLSCYSKLDAKEYHMPIADVNVMFLKSVFELVFKVNFTLKGEYKSIATHDIDYPFITKNVNLKALFKNTVGDVLMRKSILLAIKRLYSYVTGDKRFDPANNIEWIINSNQNKVSQSIFFYIAISRKGELDTLCDISDEDEKKQIKSVIDADEEIGLHPSYLTSENYEYFKEEKSKLDNVLKSIGSKEISSSRQHYLRFDIRSHYRNIEELDISHEYSLGFTDYCGFRSGTCRPYFPFDVLNRSKHKFTVHPLLIMDTTLLKYLKTSKKEILNIHSNFSKTVKNYKGEFIYLWHNTELMTSRGKKLYKEILKVINH